VKCLVSVDSHQEAKKRLQEILTLEMGFKRVEGDVLNNFVDM